MFLSYLCSVQLLSAYHGLHVFIAIYCTASLQLSWHLCYEKTRRISLICFTPTLHQFMYVEPPLSLCNVGGMVVAGQLQHLTHPAPPLLRHLSAPVFLVQNAPFFRPEHFTGMVYVLSTKYNSREGRKVRWPY